MKEREDIILKRADGRLNISKIRSDFPILSQKVYGKPLVYFDNAASTQKPIQVIDAISNYYKNEHSNIHRGVHYLSQHATDKYEKAREIVRTFLNASKAEEIIFTSGTTGGINLVASGLEKLLRQNDEVIISYLEHHSNIVPWQMACERSGAKLKVIPINESGELIIEEYEKLINHKTRIVAVNHVSNSLGTINPIKQIIDIAHKEDIPVLIDGAQAVAHFNVDVQELDADFYVFSGHKIYGPTGSGILYGKEKWLNKLPLYQGGGDMIKQVSFEKTTYNDLPHKFEAGTPNIAGGIGLGEALHYLQKFDITQVAKWEQELLNYATQQLKEIGGIRFVGMAANKTSVISFLVDGCHPYDVGALLDQQGIAVRTGHHCTQPIMDWYKIPGTIRASFSLYNTKEEVDAFIKALQKARTMLL